MSEEMKMSDYFVLPVYEGEQTVNIINRDKPCIVSGTGTTMIARKKYINPIIHAINNHDTLTEQVRQLREGFAECFEWLEMQTSIEYQEELDKFRKLLEQTK